MFSTSGNANLPGMSLEPANAAFERVVSFQQDDQTLFDRGRTQVEMRSPIIIVEVPDSLP
jgi:hypothetical protein